MFNRLIKIIAGFVAKCFRFDTTRETWDTTEYTFDCSGGSGTCTTNTNDFFLDGTGLGYWKFNDNVEDSLNNYDATPINITYGVGKFLNAASWVAGQSYAQVNTTDFNLQTFSVSIWFNMTEFQSVNEKTCIIGNYGYAARLGGNGWYLQVDDSKMGIEIPQFGQRVTASTDVVLATWQHIVISVEYTAGVSSNTRVIKIFYNGVSESATTFSDTDAMNYDDGAGGNANDRLSFGTRGQYNFTGGSLTGALDQCRIFNRVLNATEAKELFDEKQC